MSDRRELAGGILFLGAIVAAMVLIAVGGVTGWPAVPVLAAFIGGALLLSDS